MSARVFTLHRIFPDGREAPTYEGPLPRCRGYIGRSLNDNGKASKSEARMFATSVEPDGTTHHHPSGYAYIIDPDGPAKRLHREHLVDHGAQDDGHTWEGLDGTARDTYRRMARKVAR